MLACREEKHLNVLEHVPQIKPQKILPNYPTNNKSEDKSFSLSSAPDPGDDYGYWDFLKAHPRSLETAKGEQAWSELVERGTDPKSLIGAAARYAEISKTYDADKIKFADNWLIDGAWKQHLPSPADPTASSTSHAAPLRKHFAYAAFKPASAFNNSGFGSRKTYPLPHTVSILFSPSVAAESFLRSLQMKTSMIFSSGSSIPP